MPAYLLTAELNFSTAGPHDAYHSFRARLAILGAQQVMTNQWAVRSSGKARDLREDLSSYLADGDRLTVVELTPNFASWHPLAEVRLK